MKIPIIKKTTHALSGHASYVLMRNFEIVASITMMRS